MRNVGSPFSRSQALGRFKVRAAPTGIDILCAFCSRPPCFWDSPSAVTDLQALLASSKAEVLAARDKATHSAMNIAAYHLNVEGVKALIAAGADVSNPDKNGHRPLRHKVLSKQGGRDQATKRPSWRLSSLHAQTPVRKMSRERHLQIYAAPRRMEPAGLP